MKTSCLLAFLLTLSQAIMAQTYNTNVDTVQTFAGSAFTGYVDGQGTSTMFNDPQAVVADPLNNLFVLDFHNNCIRKITPGRAVSTFIGRGTASAFSGCGTNVSMNALAQQCPMAIDHLNVLRLAEYIYSGGFSLVEVDGDGCINSTFLTVAYGTVGGVCVDSGNNTYFSDQEGDVLYRYRTNGVLEVFVGSGNPGSADGNGLFTSFSSPSALAADAADNIYVWDAGNHLIRRINQNRDVVTIAGNTSTDRDGVGRSASFASISAMCADGSGNVILACGSSIRIMSVTTNVTTLAGSFTQSGFTDQCAGNLARFSGANGVCVAQGAVFVADSGNQRIRQITFNPAPQPQAAGVRTNQFGFTITGTSGLVVVVEACTNPANAIWSPVGTNTLTAGSSYFSDPRWTNYTRRFYRLRSP